MTAHKYPFYLKAALIIIGLYFLFNILYICQFIILPILFSIIIAILLLPLVDFLVRIRINRVVSIIISILLFLAVGVGTIILISKEIGEFSETIPLLIDKSHSAVDSAINWLSSTFNIRIEKIQHLLSTIKTAIAEGGKNYLGDSFLFIGNGLTIIFLVPVYVFMFLYYKPLLLHFILKVNGKRTNLR